MRCLRYGHGENVIILTRKSCLHELLNYFVRRLRLFEIWTFVRKFISLI